MKYLLGLHGETIQTRIDERLNGVGMIRSEYLCRKIEEYFTLESCCNYVRAYVDNVCSVFDNNDVWYRTAELIVPEVNVLRGADYILDEKHYILGLRGVRRGIKYPNTFYLELANMAKLSRYRKNLHILFPFIKDAKELETCIDLLIQVGFENKYGIMAEIPSTIICIDDFLSLGISNITIGVNDLTTFVLGTYRGSGYHDCTHPAVVKMIETVIDKAKSKNVQVNVAGNVNIELCKICESIGVDNFVVNYPLLPDILNIPPQNLPDMNLLKDIKALTKKRRREG